MKHTGHKSSVHRKPILHKEVKGLMLMLLFVTIVVTIGFVGLKLYKVEVAGLAYKGAEVTLAGLPYPFVEDNKLNTIIVVGDTAPMDMIAAQKVKTYLDVHVTEAADNCPDVYNPGQHDSDADGVGNACDCDSDGYCTAENYCTSRGMPDADCLPALVNVAIGKNCSSYEGVFEEVNCSRALDGNFETMLQANYRLDNWIDVFLDSPQNIKKIVIYAGDGCDIGDGVLVLDDDNFLVIPQISAGSSINYTVDATFTEIEYAFGIIPEEIPPNCGIKEFEVYAPAPSQPTDEVDVPDGGVTSDAVAVPSITGYSVAEYYDEDNDGVPMPEVLIASQVRDLDDQNMILIGTAGTNPLINQYSRLGVEEGAGLIRLVQNGDNIVLVVTGGASDGVELALCALNKALEGSLLFEDEDTLIVGGTCENPELAYPTWVTECTDSDGGENYDMKGILVRGEIQKEDYCWKDSENPTEQELEHVNILKEYSCELDNPDDPNIEGYGGPEDTGYYDINYNCPNGCSDGACVEIMPVHGVEIAAEQLKVTDTATPAEYIIGIENEGTVTDSFGFMIDYPYGTPIDVTTPEIVGNLAPNEKAERTLTVQSSVTGTYEFGITAYSLTEPTATDSIILTLSVTEPLVCTDSDGGEDYYVKGNVTGITRGGDYVEWEDSCGKEGAWVTDPDFLMEMYCSSDNIVNGDDSSSRPSVYECPNGCSDGACIIPEEPKRCRDSDGGMRYYAAGSVINEKFESEDADYCKTEMGDIGERTDEGPVLAEFYCGANATTYVSEYLCPNGCKDSACIGPERYPAYLIEQDINGYTYIRSEMETGHWAVPVYVAEYNDSQAKRYAAGVWDTSSREEAEQTLMELLEDVTLVYNSSTKMYESYTEREAVFAWMHEDHVIAVVSDNIGIKPEALANGYLEKYPSDLTGPVLPQQYGVDISAEPTYRGTDTVTPAEYIIMMENTGTVPDNYEFIITAPEEERPEIINLPSFEDFAPGEAQEKTITLADTIPGTYKISIHAVSEANPEIISNTVTLTLEVTGQYAKTFNFKQGLNLIALPSVPSDTIIRTLLADVLDKIEVIYGYDASSAQKWLVFYPNESIPQNLATFEPGKAYWIRFKEGATMTITGTLGMGEPPVVPSIQLTAGWNLVGVHSVVPMTMQHYFDNIEGKYSSVWHYNQQTRDVEKLAIAPETILIPGEGYWIYMKEAGVIIP